MKTHSLSLLSTITSCLKETLANDTSIIKVDNFRRSSKQGTTSTLYFFTATYLSRESKNQKEFVLKIYREGFERIGQKEVNLLFLFHRLIVSTQKTILSTLPS